MKMHTYNRCLASSTLLALVGFVLVSLLPHQANRTLAATPQPAMHQGQSNTPSQAKNWPPCAVIPGELILLGNGDAIDTLLNALDPNNLELKQSTPVDWMQNPTGGGDSGGNGGDGGGGDDDDYEDPFVVSPQTVSGGSQLNLYTITDTATVEDMLLTTLPDTLAQLTDVDIVMAPNCQSGSHGHSARGSPALPLGSEVSPAAFLTQSALSVETPGIGIYSESRRMALPTGAGVRVAVLDTSPFSASVPDGAVADYTMAFPLVAQSGLTLPDLNLRVSHAITLADLDPGPFDTSMADHGLFAAAQIHAVAPESAISLYRVLDDQGNGDIYTIAAAVSEFVTANRARNHPSQCSVINMSLGIPVDGADITALEPLYTTLREAHELGITIVASAGNDSRLTRYAQSMNQPASYPFVLGVTSSDTTGDRACYANSGDIAAPGGNGNLNCTEVSTQDHVVSLVHNPERGEQFATWAGTSFAAPWVSGLAALIQEQEACRADPQRVGHLIALDALERSADLGEGIITLPDSLIDATAGDDVLIPNPVREQAVFLPLVQR